MTQTYTVYKDGTTSQPFNLDPSATLQNVRAALGSYMTDDYRFLDYQNTSVAYSDMILSKDSERFAPLSSVVGLHNQLYLTNINKTAGTDLVGFNSNWFFDRYMSCGVDLNREANAAPLNNGKMPPLMLTNVKTANPNIQGFGAMDNVVVCERNSIITFRISSWGAAGFGYDIRPEAGTPITGNPLYITFANCSPTNENYAQAGLQRYSTSDAGSNGQMIKVVPTSSMQLQSGQTLQYMKFTIKTWVVTEYARNSDGSGKVTCPGTLPTSHTTALPTRRFALASMLETAPGSPFGALAGAPTGTIVVPGNTISPGSTVPAGQQSTQNIGTIWNVQDDQSPAGVIGQVTFYVFVFDSHDDAVKVFSGVNDIDPSVWQH